MLHSHMTFCATSKLYICQYLALTAGMPIAYYLVPSTLPNLTGVSTMHGTVTVPFTTLILDTINTHGLAWAVQYYYKRLPQWQARFFIRAALAI